MTLVLSPTVRRWARLSIMLATRIWQRKTSGAGESNALVYVCDEPETGLPVAAQRHLSNGLASLYRDFGVTFIVATHSAAILADPEFNPVKVGRRPDAEGNESATVDLLQIDPNERRRLELAGAPPAEMLYLYKRILIVEGVHDLWVLDELVGSELENLRTKVLPVHGAKKASGLCASEAGFLLEHAPEAKFIVAVDGTNQELLQAMLDEARQAAGKPERLAALDQVVARYGNPSDEAKVMHSLLRKAIESDRVDGLGGLFGFRERDIIEYLDPAAFGLDLTWPQLRAEHQERLDNKKGTTKDFKKWLTETRNASFDEATIRSAVPQDSVPEEVLTLLDLCQRAGNHGGSEGQP